MKTTILFVAIFLSFSAFSQESPNTEIEQQLENISETQGEEVDNELLLNLNYLQKHPININSGEINNLKDLPFADNLKIENLIDYKRLFGVFISIYELQAIPGWDLDFINKILPFITIGNPILEPSLMKRFRGGETTFLFRVSRILQKSEGYIKTSNTKYLGSPEKIFLRYRYQFKNILQYGFIAEKDAGEELFKGQSKTGFDFYSFHLVARNIGKIKTVVIGDYSINLGQGLIYWQSFSLGKGSEILAIKRQGAILKPYSSAGEVNFLRGAGLTIAQNKWSTTLFASFKKNDANINGDSLFTYVTSMQTSGYHRTASEIADRKSQNTFTIGGNLTYNSQRFIIGLNAVNEKYKYSIIKPEVAYNNFNFTGKNQTGVSTDFSFTINNFHFFGEVAKSVNGHAFVGGLLASLSSQISLSLLYRSLGRSFNSINGDAFSESSNPNNERGFFTGINVKLPRRWTINAYIDVFKFPYLKYRINRGSSGFSSFIQATYKPNKSFEGYIYYKIKQKEINGDIEDEIIYPVVNQTNKNIRLHFWYKINSSFSFASRAEISGYQKYSLLPEDGFMLFADIIYKPFGKKWSFNSRLQYFETGSYNTRIYSYEKDVLSASTIPALFDRGLRAVLNAKCNFNNSLAFWFKISHNIYDEKEFIGSGMDKISGNKKTEIKLQAIISF
ncbi:MAG: hypothetical protein ABIP68_08380 [Ferruginibacter sp.]